MIRSLSRGFAGRLLLGQVMVITAGAATLALVAFAVGPAVFHSHIQRSPTPISDAAREHVDQAFMDATLVALGFATLAAVVAAVAVSGLLALRMTRPLDSLARTARAIAGGRYQERVSERGPTEVVILASAFNEMAQALDHAERQRRALIADVAHELRTPLATIEGYTEGLRDGVIAADDVEAWDALHRETRRLERLVDDLAKVSRAEERQLDLRLEPVGTADALADASRAAAPAFEEKGVELRTAVQDAVPSVIADRDRLGEVLANLIDNALRHTPPGGRVTLSACRCGQDVELGVEDTGTGIQPADLPHVFERFYRADRARSRSTGGSGIGLTIAKAIIQAHGGTIRAESDGAGRGARFVIALPIAPGHDR